MRYPCAFSGTCDDDTCPRFPAKEHENPDLVAIFYNVFLPFVSIIPGSYVSSIRHSLKVGIVASSLLMMGLDVEFDSTRYTRDPHI